MNDRILLILKTQNMTSSQFADEIGVQRSNISHILSGRNNPSLEFVMKIIKRFPDLSLEWLIFGKGSMYKERNTTEEKKKIKPSSEKEKQFDLFSDYEEIENKNDEIKPLQDNVNDLEEEDDAKYSQQNELSNKSNNENKINEVKISEKEIIEEKKENPEVYHKKVEPQKKIEKIVIFYDDRTFREYFAE